MPDEAVAVGKVFISYRRDDSSGYVNALQPKLEEHFGDGAIVRDLSDIRPGVDFRHFIADTLNGCSVLLALIGPHWLSAMDQGGRRRLKEENDLVRAEIAQALQQQATLVIPILVGGARMPPESRLPPDISALCRRSAVVLDDARWDHDVNGLIDAIQDALRDRGLDVSDAYLKTLQRRFEEAGLECRTDVPRESHRFGLVAKGLATKLIRQSEMPFYLKITRGTFTFFSISVHRDVAPDRLRDICSDCSGLFVREHGRFRSYFNEDGNFCFPVVVLTRSSTAIDSFVRTATPGAHLYLFTVPVIVDLSARKVHVFEAGTLSRMTWGIAAYPAARQLAQSVLGTWPT